ncbi:hypothetical protein [Ancylobacter terrae]|uniref:hypothetical protein n=1 Tax=Ancylobacter sp. sgz301288 TaxID=3342077 RepID=UPI00385D93D7
MGRDTIDVEIRLRDIRNFFTEPDIDPFEGEIIDLSGIEQVMDALKSRPGWRRCRLRTRLSVPFTAETASIEARMPEALRAYCDKHIQYCERKIREVRIEGRRGLRVGALFLAACMAASASVDTLLAIPGLLGQLLSEGLLIAGWVGLWRPIELLLYEWWPYSRDIALYRKIRDMTLVIEPAPAASPSA